MSALARGFRREARRLVMVDLENVAGGGLRTTAAAAWARRVVEEAATVVPGEQVIVGVSSKDGLFHAKKAWPQARVVLELGRDGADHALLDVLDSEAVGERFGRVSIVSGDGIFAEAAAELGTQGVTVTVLGWRRCMASRLRLAAGVVAFLDDRRSSEGGVAA
ncbi:MAG: hypothetical protein ABIR57_00435 [Aeromicrobium sp.]